ncbi:hypothetical protein NPIL_451191 [Nephila pilipes]|uniref:Secreted protein n=1 Tax=Nephila pilipes TaxID=299642 RepID=A0A8X6THQ8_NEPPI|nr:hypothetical protein NPIL_451191 [Nephila pilipes]
MIIVGRMCIWVLLADIVQDQCTHRVDTTCFRSDCFIMTSCWVDCRARTRIAFICLDVCCRANRDGTPVVAATAVPLFAVVLSTALNFYGPFGILEGFPALKVRFVELQY